METAINDLAQVNFADITFLGLIGIGAVNVITMIRPTLDSKLKFVLSALIVFIATFIPVELGNVILEKAKLAIEVAFASSGTYKLFSMFRAPVTVVK